jgi:hypothetical protein
VNADNTISEQDWELMEDYLSGKMTQPEQSAFKARLDTEPALQEIRLLITGIKESVLTEKLDLFHKAATEKTPSIAPSAAPVRKMRTYWVAAAATIIVIALSVIFFFNGNNDAKLVAAYFEPDPGTATTMGASENYAFDRGMVDYKSGKYAAAIEAWRPLLAANNTSDTLNYFSGISFLALYKADSAEIHLRPVWNNDTSSFFTDAGWYLSLALLSQGKRAEARTLLQQTKHPKKDELLARIN